MSSAPEDNGGAAIIRATRSYRTGDASWLGRAVPREAAEIAAVKTLVVEIVDVPIPPERFSENDVESVKQAAGVPVLQAAE